MKRLLLLFVIIGISLATSSVAESSDNDLTWQISLSSAVSNENPLWLFANRFGEIPQYSTRNMVFSIRSEEAMLWQNERFSLNYGVGATSSINDVDNVFFMSNTYASFESQKYILRLGWFEDLVGYTAPRLSSGSFMVSKNARQPVKALFSTNDFIEVPFTAGYLEFKARWSEALLFDERHIENARIHQKYLYVNIKPIPDLNLMGGVVHNLMWGGVHPDRGRMHPRLRDYLSDIFAQPAEESITPLGNGVSAYDFAAEYNHGSYDVGIYRLFYLEDRVSTRFRSPWDGMWGAFIEFKNKSNLVNLLVYEHINTKQQDARKGIDAFGRARYYSHSTWLDGWTHGGHVIGNPLITIDPDMLGTGDRNLVNNIIIGHHLGISGKFQQDLSYNLLATYSRNYGVCTDQLKPDAIRCFGTEENPIPERDYYIPLSDLRQDRVNLLYEMLFHHLFRNDLTLSVSLALDLGEFYEQTNYGMNVGLQWKL